MAVALVLTVVTAVDYVYRALTLRRTSARAMRAAAARRAAGPTAGADGARTDPTAA
jgi:CDP-diacylglycerol--glycerol-3-phosphate 3-phosphatidyltransferase